MKNLSKHLGVQLSDELLEKSMKMIDENGNSELEFDEFLHWLSNVNSSKSDEFAVLKSKIRAQGARPLTNAQIEQLREVFQHFDADGSGTIDVEELGTVFESMGQALSQQELESLMKQADDDGSGEIDFEEFLMLMCTSFGATHSFDGDLLAAFRKFDPEQTGMVSLEDLRALILQLVGSEALDATELDEIVNVAHERGDGYIEYLKWDALWDACRGLN
jgi:Ca2+-binding EF-hand superfamily protein